VNGLSQRISPWILVLLLATCLSQTGRGQDTQTIDASCRSFVQSFYDWYIKQLDSSNGSLKDRPSAFGPKLYDALMEDMEAQAKADEIVGLDWDPILSGNGRPFGDHYLVGRITVKSEAVCWAELHDTPSGKKSDEPVVAAELENKDGQWRFLNFYYASPKSGFSNSLSHGGLLTILKNLRASRLTGAKTTPPAKPAPQSNNSGPGSKQTPAAKPTPQN
jgi:hypothetical protein